MSSTTKPPVNLAARRKAKPVAVPAEPAMIAIAITLVFTVDGQPAHAVRVPGEFPTPPEGKAAHLTLTLDARTLLQRLEPALGPQAPRIWTPGA